MESEFERESGDIVIEEEAGCDAVDLTTGSGPNEVAERGDSDGKEMEPENAVQFESTFKGIMLTLSEHIRFTAMNPLFFVRLVQQCRVLPAERIVDVQNWTLCKVGPLCMKRALVTTPRRRRYLRYFHDIQCGVVVPRSGSRKQHRNRRSHRMIGSNRNEHHNRSRSARAAVTEEEGKSEGHGGGEGEGVGGDGQQQEGDGSDAVEESPRDLCFDHFQVCFDAARCGRLRVNDHIDHRDNVGRFANAIIVDVDAQRQKVKLHYIGWQSKWDLWCDVSMKVCCSTFVAVR